MTTVLLIIIYIAFIGLGIPDSLFGTAWPAIYSEFGLPISFGSFVTVIISCGTISSSMLSARLINRFGTNKVTAVSTALTAAALLGYSLSGNFVVLCLLALPLGLGAGSIDTALNNYVSLHYSATHMSFLHCFYGVGVTVSPYVMSLVISGESGWRGGYQIAFIMQLCITLLLFLTLPLWKKAHKSTKADPETPAKTLTFREMMRLPGVKLMCCMFMMSCAIEFTCGGWGSTFLVEYKHMGADQAAGLIMFYYIGIALGRLASGLLAKKLHSWQIIAAGQTVLGAALVILLLPGSAYLAAAGLFLVGLGNGPLFPNFSYLTPENFGEEASQSVMGVEVAMSNVGILLAPPLCGILGQVIGMGIFPVYLLVFYGIMLAATFRIKKVLHVNGGRV